MGYKVGRIIEVKGLSIKAKLNKILPPYIVENGKRESSPKINGFVKTKVGIETIICQVVGEYNIENTTNISDYYLDLQVRGNIDNGMFVQGLRMLPIVSAEIETLDQQDYSIMYHSVDNGICIGNDLFDEKRQIYVNINNLIASHIGVFGNTGSGKSNTLTKILNEYSKILFEYKTNRSKCIIFDLNNEYGKNAICANDNKVTYHLTTRKDSKKKIPLKLSDLSEDEFITLLNATEKTQVPVIKNAYRKTFSKEKEYDEYYYKKIIISIIKNNKKNLFQTIRHQLKDYIRNIDNFKYHSKYETFYYQEEDATIYPSSDYFENYISNIKVFIPRDQADRFIFDLCFSVAIENENGIQLDYMMPLISRANKLFNDFKHIFDFNSNNKSIFNGKNICVVQLGTTNMDMKEIVPAIISNHIFNKLANVKEDKGEIVQTVNIVIDEAHNILYEDRNSLKSHSVVLDTFEKIVKEGRKFGCYLLISSQRPSDISQTIISQMHNYFIHKLVNPGDISKIRNAVAYLDSKSLDFITVLAPGECIVSGTAFQLPTFVYVDQVNDINRPNSENVKLAGNNSLFSRDLISTNEEI